LTAGDPLFLVAPKTMCNYDCTKTCVNCFQKKCEDSIFHQIQNYEGEMSEEDFDTLVVDIKHSEIDEAITYAFWWDVETMVNQYGLLKALKLYESEMGGSSNLIKSALDGNGSKDHLVYMPLLYLIVQENIEITWTYYQQYCVAHPVC
jgi:hypothetical protein